MACEFMRKANVATLVILYITATSFSAQSAAKPSARATRLEGQWYVQKVLEGDYGDLKARYLCDYAFGINVPPEVTDGYMQGSFWMYDDQLNPWKDQFALALGPGTGGGSFLTAFIDGYNRSYNQSMFTDTAAAKKKFDLLWAAWQKWLRFHADIMSRDCEASGGTFNDVTKMGPVIPIPSGE